MIKPADALPLLMKMGTILKSAMDHFVALKASGADADPDILAQFILLKLNEWDPKLGKKSLLDPETRSAGARFLAGIAINASP